MDANLTTAPMKLRFGWIAALAITIALWIAIGLLISVLT
jgi:hypothetical protein